MMVMSVQLNDSIIWVFPMLQENLAFRTKTNAEADQENTANTTRIWQAYT
jgi:hypothetical protein